MIWASGVSDSSARWSRQGREDTTSHTTRHTQTHTHTHTHTHTYTHTHAHTPIIILLHTLKRFAFHNANQVHTVPFSSNASIRMPSCVKSWRCHGAPRPINCASH